VAVLSEDGAAFSFDRVACSFGELLVLGVGSWAKVQELSKKYVSINTAVNRLEVLRYFCNVASNGLELTQQYPSLKGTVDAAL
jgi:hypothetical protein